MISELLGWQSQMALWTQITQLDTNTGTAGAHTSNPSALTPFSKQNQPEISPSHQTDSLKELGEGTTGTVNVSQFIHLKSHYQQSPRPPNWRVTSTPYITEKTITPYQSSTKSRANYANIRLPQTSSPFRSPQSTLYTQ